MEVAELVRDEGGGVRHSVAEVKVDDRHVRAAPQCGEAHDGIVLVAGPHGLDVVIRERLRVQVLLRPVRAKHHGVADAPGGVVDEVRVVLHRGALSGMVERRANASGRRRLLLTACEDLVSDGDDGAAPKSVQVTELVALNGVDPGRDLAVHLRGALGAVEELLTNDGAVLVGNPDV